MSMTSVLKAHASAVSPLIITQEPIHAETFRMH